MINCLLVCPLGLLNLFMVLVFELKRSAIVSETALYAVVLIIHTTSLLKEMKNSDLNRTSFTTAAIRGVCGITWHIRYGCRSVLP